MGFLCFGITVRESDLHLCGTLLFELQVLPPLRCLLLLQIIPAGIPVCAHFCVAYMICAIITSHITHVTWLCMHIMAAHIMLMRMGAHRNVHIAHAHHDAHIFMRYDMHITLCVAYVMRYLCVSCDDDACDCCVRCGVGQYLL